MLLKALTRTVACVSWIVLAVTTGCRTNPVVAGDPVKSNQAFTTITQQRSKAEQEAAILKSLKAPGTREYNKGQQLYVAASSAFNGVVDTLRVNAEAGQSVDENSLSASLREAAGAAAAFNEYVRGVQQGQEMGPDAATAAANAIFQALFPAAKDVIEYGRNLQEADRHRYAASIATMKWSNFENIGATANPTTSP